MQSLPPSVDREGGPTQAISEASQKSATGISRFLKKASTSRPGLTNRTVFNHHGSPGLNTLFTPSDPQIEYVFVHGLGGGSTKTWCLQPDPTYFWPQEWLPRLAAFGNVRIHSFGYNSNWMETGPSIVDVHDFGQALLLVMRNSPCFTTNPVVFVAHSMGGIVIKEAYIMARQDPECHPLAARIVAMVFLATPHRGSDYATFLNRILRLSALHGTRQYISNLERCSSSLVKINDTFRNYCNDLMLYSYFETKELRIGVGSSALIVQKDSAIAGLPGERVSMLDADHRSICKFGSSDDPNYLILTDAFATINRELAQKLSDKNSERLGEQLQQIETYLGMPETPEDDLEDLDDIRIPGSCGWFTDSTEFQDWVNTPPTTGPKVFWVHAKPATGKSVLASHVIRLTQGSNNDCCYYFFRHGDKIRSTLAGCLLSFVYQVSTLNEDVRNKILVMIARGVRFEPDNAKSIWRQIVKPVLSHATTSQPLFWIIDALDECSDVSTFFTIFLKIDPCFPVRVFITSRRTEEIAAGFAQMELTSALAPILSKEIQFRDTQNSILLYLESNKHKLHVGTEQERQALITRMLEKSQGIFLWVRLVLEELSTVWTAKQVEQVLEDVPQEMNLLYSRAVQLIGSRPAHSIAVASAILIWSVCAIRPMTISELQCALELDIGTTVQDPEQAIPSLCSQLVHVDKNGRVLMVHLTAKSFLQERGLESPLTICPILGHRRIACVCLRFLLSDEMKPPSGRRIVDRKRATRKPSMFLKYASFNFAEHMWRTTSDNKVISPLLYEILQKNVFTWIQVMATENSLHVLIHAANLIKNYYQRQTKYFPPLGEQIKLVSAWTVDLHRLVARFGRNMVLQPDSIYSLIPPFCPRSSAVATVFGTPPKCIEVVGLEDNGWDDRLACIDSHDTQAYAVASGEGYFAVGFGSSIDICHSTTCQKWKSLNHGSPIRQLGFDSTGNILISVGRRDVRVWDLEEDSCLATLDVKFDILTFSLRDEAAGFVIALKDHSTVRFTLKTSEVSSGLPWKSAFEDEGEFRRPPLVAAFSPDASLLAVVYRGRPITIWDVEENELCGLIGRENQDLSSLALGANTSPSSLVFNREESLRLLAVAYEDGDLCLFDYDELKLVKTIEAYAQYVACSPDGATLATGDWNGTIQLFEFETLQLLFKVNAADYGIRSLAFSSDNSRLIDARGTQCNIWEPALPSGRLRKDDVSSNRESTEPRIVGISDSEGEITRIETEDQGDWFFAGKSDGTVWLHQTGDGKPNRLLYRHRHGMSVLQLVWGNERNVLVSSDLGGQFIVFSLERDGTGGFRDPIRRIDVKGDVGQVFSISQILLNKSNDLLLVSTAVSDTVWNLDEGRIISSCQFPQRQSFRWLNNPLDNDERILVGAESISVCDWVTCEVKPPRVVSNLALGLMYPKSQTIKSVTKAFNSKLVVELSEFSMRVPPTRASF